jgi:hypothetical protein
VLAVSRGWVIVGGWGVGGIPILPGAASEPVPT